jgi:hypothetical protein
MPLRLMPNFKTKSRVLIFFFTGSINISTTSPAA